ncbi:GntR family transcriptional regulator [Dactylosporangium roseum]
MPHDGVRGEKFLRPVAPASLGQLAAENLISAIVRGELKPGEHLSEVALGEKLGVSRTPLREALNQLVVDRLLVREPNRGVRVTELDADQVDQFYDCRVLLETRVIALAAPVVRDEGLTVMRRLLDTMREIEQNPPAVDARWDWLDLVEKFHDAYRVDCPNQEMVALVRGMNHRALRYRAITVARPGRMVYSINQHQRILRALEQRNPQEAESELRTLLESSKAVLRQHLSRQADHAASGEAASLVAKGASA